MDLTEKKKSGNDWRFHACLDTTMVGVLSSKELRSIKQEKGCVFRFQHYSYLLLSEKDGMRLEKCRSGLA